jgi:hypothetical protein
VSDTPWPARLSPKALPVLNELPEHAQEMVRDVLDIVGWLRSLLAAAFVRHFGQQMEVDGLGNVHEK